MTLTSSQSVSIRMESPVHEIHREILARGERQGLAVEIVAAGPQLPAEVSAALGRPVVMESTAPPLALTWREWVVLKVLRPNLAFLTLVLGWLLVYVEFCRPGTVVPGAVGGVLVILALYGLAAWKLHPLGISLLLVAAVLFCLPEYPIFVGAAAAVAMCAGATLLVDAPEPFRIRPALAIGVTIPFAIVTMFLTQTAWRARRNKTMEQKYSVVFTTPGDIFSVKSLRRRRNRT